MTIGSSSVVTGCVDRLADSELEDHQSHKDTAAPPVHTATIGLSSFYGIVSEIPPPCDILTLCKLLTLRLNVSR